MRVAASRVAEGMAGALGTDAVLLGGASGQEA